MSGQALGPLAVEEVVPAEILVGAVIAQDVVGADEDRVGDGDDRLLVPAASLDPRVLSVQVGAARAPRGRVGGLDERGAKPAVALRVLPLLRLPADSSFPGQIAAQLAA